MNRLLKRFLASFGLLMLILIPGGHAHAAPAPVIPTGVTVSPVIQQVHLQPGQSSASFTALLTNNTKNPITITSNSIDFVANGQQGGLSFLNKPSNDINIVSHELASNLSITPNQLSLAPAAAQKVTITIQNANTLAAGGHYGATIYHVSTSSPTNTKNGNRVSLQQAISTLIFAFTDGRGTQGVKLLPLNLRAVTLHFPQTVNILFEATGNTQVTPRGVLTLYRGTKDILGSTLINVNSGLVLPGGSRLYNTLVPTKSIAWWPAHYHVHIDYRLDGQDSYKTYDTTFLYINVWHIVLTIIYIAVILWALIKLKRYYRHLYRLSRLENIRKLKIRRRTKKVKKVRVAPAVQVPKIVLPQHQTETEETSSADAENEPAHQPVVEVEVESTADTTTEVPLPNPTVKASSKSAKISTKTTTKTSNNSKKRKSPAKPKKATPAAKSVKPRNSAAKAKAVKSKSVTKKVSKKTAKKTPKSSK